MNHNNINSPILRSDFGGVSGSHYTHQVNMQGSNSLELNLNSPYFGSATEALMLNSSTQSFGSYMPSSNNTFPSQYTFQRAFLNTMQNQSTISHGRIEAIPKGKGQPGWTGAGFDVDDRI